MSRLIFKNFTKTNLEEKKLILSWRNSDKIRLKMVNQDIITWENHEKFIENLAKRTDCIYKIIYIDEEPIGVTSCTDIDIQIKTCNGGIYIGNKNYSGYGTLILFYGYQYVFETLGMLKHTFEVKKVNKRVYLMHKNIFHAKDNYETANEWFLYYDLESWHKMKEELEEKIKSFYDIEQVIEI